jgi:hypothetical protein
MKILKATRLAASDIEEFDAVFDLNDDDNNDKVNDFTEESEFEINDDTDETTIVDYIVSLKFIAKVLLLYLYNMKLFILKRKRVTLMLYSRVISKEANYSLNNIILYYTFV